MANQKLTQLAALGAQPAITDLMYMVDDPSGSATSKKMTVGNLIGMVDAMPGAARLGAAVSSGTTFTTRTALSPSYRGLVVLSPFSSGAEVLTVTGISGTTVTVSQTIGNSHAADAAIWLDPNGVITPELFGGATKAALQLAVDRAVAGTTISFSGTIAFSAGDSLSITVNNITLTGHGVGSAITIPPDTAADVVSVSGASNVTLRNFKITRTGTPSTTDEIRGVVITTGSANVLVDHVYEDGCRWGFVIGEDGTTECTDITLRDCTATHSTTATNNSSRYGFVCDDVNRVTLENCVASKHWLDGFKLRTNSKNVHLLNCKSLDNGVSGGGNGIDSYYGGEQFTVAGGYYKGNVGGGIYIKTGDKNTSGGGGAIANNITITGPTCEYNIGAGLQVTRVTAASTSQMLASHITVNGGQYNYNGEIGGTGTSQDVGIYLRGRGITINGAVVKGNERQGIFVAEEAFDVQLNGLLVQANGQKTADTYPGLQINGKWVTVVGGSYDGKDATYAAQESDITGATAYQNYGIRVMSTADEVRIIDPVIKNNAQSVQWRVDMTTGTCIVKIAESGVNATSRYGGPGSVFTRSDTGSIWYKLTGYGVTGWTQIHPWITTYSRTVAQLPAASSYTGVIAFASNGRKAGEGAGAGSGVLVFSDGTNWIAVDTGVAVAA